ncbi:uncharacterized protein LOC125040237 [Penaeus chinensis]|uniref:uncharacterized protein LOC125040237 n=1 Tax=Penaeus chinensis TaxID=139456 RepID=UPI001FB83B78|nr:uncharacterized protein LOC125040237 [Penaeus chinensis]
MDLNLRLTAYSTLIYLQICHFRSPVFGLNGVASLVKHCKKLSHLVNLYNQIFSSLVALTFLAFLATLFNSIYYVIISFGNWAMFYGGGLSYVATVICLFYLLCERADALRRAHGMVEDAILDLQHHPDTVTDDMNRLLSLSLHLKNNPAYISVGGVSGLGLSTLVAMVNVALTYTAILFQYRPASRKDQ